MGPADIMASSDAYEPKGCSISGLAPIEAPPEKEKEAERTKRGAREDERWERERERERDRDREDRESRRG